MAAQNLSASNAARLMQCPGSADLKKAIPGWAPPVEDPNKWKARTKGTTMHEILEYFGKYREGPLKDVIKLLEALAETHWRKRHPLQEDESKMTAWVLKRSTIFTDVNTSMVRLTSRLMKTRELEPKYIRFLASALQTILDIKVNNSYGTFSMWQELEMETRWLAKPGKTTVDVAWYTEQTIGVIDYKTGVIPVEATENDQLMFYTYTLWNQLFGDGIIHDQQITTFVMEIIQPGSHTTWTCSFDRLKEWAQDVLGVEQRILKGSVHLKPGDHCTFCPANPHARGEKGFPLCPAQTELLYPSAMDVDEILNIT